MKDILNRVLDHLEVDYDNMELFGEEIQFHIGQAIDDVLAILHQ